MILWVVVTMLSPAAIEAANVRIAVRFAHPVLVTVMVRVMM